MTRRIRPFVQSVTTLGAVALVFSLQACSSANNPVMTGTAGTTGSGTGTAGTTGSGAGTAGTTGSGTGTAGATGTAGTTGAGGGAFGEPVCPSAVTKGGACTPTDVQFCYKTCGPEKAGVKSETCQTSGTYAEMSGCTFDPAKDFACYKVPTAANTVCPAGVTPQGSMDCGTVPMCTLCNSTGGLPGGSYLDSTGAAKVGFCVCQAPNTSGARVWSCASDTAWPCPLGSGC